MEIFLQQSEPSTPSALLVFELLTENKLIVLPHHPYSADLTLCEFVLIPKNKIELKECTSDDITINQVQLWKTQPSFKVYSENVSSRDVISELVV